jgi:hypothetical protein
MGGMGELPQPLTPGELERLQWLRDLSKRWGPTAVDHLAFLLDCVGRLQGCLLANQQHFLVQENHLLQEIKRLSVEVETRDRIMSDMMLDHPWTGRMVLQSEQADLDWKKLLSIMPCRVRKGLMKKGIDSIPALTALSACDIFSMRNVGETSLAWVRSELARQGRALAPCCLRHARLW